MISGAYMLTVSVVFIWRHKNIIKNREGEWLIQQCDSLAYDSPKRWYNFLNKSFTTNLNQFEVEQWNEYIDNLNRFWIRIYISIFIKSIFFPLLWAADALICFIFLIETIADKIKKIKFSPLKNKKSYTPEPVVVLKESESYRELPEKVLIL